MTAPTLWFSLRRRLLVLLLGGITGFWLLMLVSSYIDAHHEIDELFDAQLARSAGVLLSIAAHEAEELGGQSAALTTEFSEHEKLLVFQVLSPAGAVLMRSPNAPSAALPQREGFSESVEGGRHWRYFSQWDGARRVRVVVGEDHALRDELIGHIATRVMFPLLFGLPLLGGWIWLATRRSLRPLDDVAADIAVRQPERLQAVVPATAPEEIRPLIEAINGLFARVERAIDDERRFTADAAHELRTPLAALAAQAQVAVRAADDDERRHALELLGRGTARAARLVDQLLTLARLDPERGLACAARVRLDEVAQRVCADHGPQALDKDIALELDAAPVEIAADEDLLRILLRNLLDNAIRYTPAGGRVNVTVAAVDGEPRIVVADSGPGIAATDRERAFDRFSRLAGQEEEGSGLGLSIVRRIADLHAARVTLAPGDGGRGLAATVAFSSPRPADA